MLFKLNSDTRKKRKSGQVQSCDAWGKKVMEFEVNQQIKVVSKLFIYSTSYNHT